VVAALRSTTAFVVAALGGGSMAAMATGTGLATTATRTWALYVPLVTMAGDRRRADEGWLDRARPVASWPGRPVENAMEPNFCEGPSGGF
jgi:hypothetical protein